MKESIEQKIKQSLDQHKMPYNGAAWTAMSAKLDAKMPVTPKSNFRYYVAASAIIVVAVASFFAFNEFNSDAKDKSTKTAHVIENKEHSETQSNSTYPENSSNVENNNSIINNVADINEEDETTVNVVEASNGVVQTQNDANNSNEPNTNDNSNNQVNNIDSNNASNSEEMNGATATTTTSTLLMPKINAVCVGDVVKVENKNDETLVIEGNDLYYIIPANATRNVRVKASGNHTIKGLNNVSNETKFFVKESPVVDFTIDSDTKFEEGIPSTSVESTVPGQSFVWIANGRKSTGRNSEAHFYEKGNHDITLTVTGSNGCKASETKSIYIEEKYNLMAVNSFMPASNDTRKNRFMPYALTQRDVKFDLIIIDPIDGHVVYQTKDASAGWDGIDSKTGSMVSYESAYIWKVVIENAEINENNEYVGNIIPIDWR